MFWTQFHHVLNFYPWTTEPQNHMAPLLRFKNTLFTLLLLRRESLKSDNAEEAHDESDKGIAAQAVHNDGTTDTTNDTAEEGVTKVRQL